MEKLNKTWKKCIYLFLSRWYMWLPLLFTAYGLYQYRLLCFIILHF